MFAPYWTWPIYAVGIFLAYKMTIGPEDEETYGGKIIRKQKRLEKIKKRLKHN